MKKQTKCKRKDCYWYSKKEKNKCCLDPAGCGLDCVQSGFEEHFENKNCGHFTRNFKYEN